MGIDNFDKVHFQKIYKGKLSEDFENGFQSYYGDSYNSFLNKLYLTSNGDTKEVAKIIGIKEAEIILHLKSYSILKTFNLTEFKNYLSTHILVILFKSLFALIFSIPIFKYVGYLIIYGYFFGEANHSLLEITLKNIPLNQVSCYIIGFIFSGVVIFFISLFKLKGLGKTFLLTGLIYFIVASTLSLSVIVFNASSNLNIVLFTKFLIVWVTPLLVASFLVMSYKIGNIFMKHFKIIGIVTLINIFPAYFLIIKFGFIQALAIILLSITLFSFLSVKVFYFVNNKRSLAREKQEEKSTDKMEIAKQKRTYKEFVFAILLSTSIIIVIIIPMFCYSLFLTGNSIGSTLSLVGLTKSENIKIGSKTLKGNIASQDNEFIYISTVTRKLLIISKDLSLEISSSYEPN